MYTSLVLQTGQRVISNKRASLRASHAPQRQHYRQSRILGSQRTNGYAHGRTLRTEVGAAKSARTHPAAGCHAPERMLCEFNEKKNGLKILCRNVHRDRQRGIRWRKHTDTVGKSDQNSVVQNENLSAQNEKSIEKIEDTENIRAYFDSLRNGLKEKSARLKKFREKHRILSKRLQEIRSETRTIVEPSAEVS
eukprot:217944_1